MRRRAFDVEVQEAAAVAESCLWSVASVLFQAVVVPWPDIDVLLYGRVSVWEPRTTTTPADATSHQGQRHYDSGLHTLFCGNEAYT